MTESQGNSETGAKVPAPTSGVANDQPVGENVPNADYDTHEYDPRSVSDEEAEDVQAAREQREADTKWRNEHPNEPLAREANPNVGGEA